MTFWSPEALRASVGGTWVVRPAPGAAIAGLSIDSRTLRAGQVFLAIRGDTHDGHAHVAAAAGAGSPLAIIESDGHAGAFPPGLGVIKVPGTRRALLRLAGAYRRTLERTRVIGVTGSSGKTTTTRLIHAVLSQSLHGTVSVKSFNNSIGVPLTILAASPRDRYLVCEIGTNAPGEVAALAGAVRPDIAVIVSVGREHLEGLGSLEAIAREEAAQTVFLEPGGVAIVHAEAPHLPEQVEALRSAHGFKVLSFGASAGADLRVGDIRAGFGGVRFTINGKAGYHVPLLGAHNAMNAAAAVAVGLRLGLDEATIARGLASVCGAEMRMEPCEAGGVRVLNDAYNANPDSMLAALDALAGLPKGPGRRAAVLGDMLELGDAGPALHAEVLERALSMADLDAVILVGPLMGAASGRRPDPRVLCIADLDGPGAAAVAERLAPGDLVLLKGSRRMRLERLIPVLRAREPQPA
ncbi:MAG: UDP-N-acetylmuramoyl-tripeptide--D-alanyl-D-alanine ligase [Phycisphaerales bacterium]|nr:UDP-N-acetylmuramoyl-tripeptide--D-alanyl-D-alanine ligase [Phycisphaerales bacterium]